MQSAIFIDCVERYNAWYAAKLAEILPEIMRQKAIDQSKPLKDLVDVFSKKEAGPYGFSSMLVCIALVRCAALL